MAGLRPRSRSSLPHDATLEDVLEHWRLLKRKIVESPGLKSLSFKELWPRMISQFVSQLEFKHKLLHTDQCLQTE
jgi:hypothetical protein